MYIPPVVIPGRQNCTNNYPCCENLVPIYPRRRWRRRRLPPPPYLQQPDQIISNLLQSRRQINIPPLPPPPPRPPRNIYRPIIQQTNMNPMQPNQIQNDCQCQLERCMCKLYSYKKRLRECNCNLRNCVCENYDI